MTSEQQMELSSAGGGTKKPERSLFEKLANSAAVVALITVVGGGIAGGVITAKMQMKAKERELVTTEYSQYVQARLKVVSEAYDLIGRTVWSATELIVITGPEFVTPAEPANENQKATAAQKQEVRTAFNLVDRQWHSAQQRTGLLLSYYHNGATDVTQRWEAVAAAINTYSACSREWFIKNDNRGIEYQKACERERNDIDVKLAALTAALEAARKAATSAATPPPPR